MRQSKSGTKYFNYFSTADKDVLRIYATRLGDFDNLGFRYMYLYKEMPYKEWKKFDSNKALEEYLNSEEFARIELARKMK